MTTPVSLTKRGQSVSLAKAAPGVDASIRFNLNWQQTAAPASGGFLGRIKNAVQPNLDLDLGCLYELADGTLGVVQALGNDFGSLVTAPFIQLDGDDRSGAVAGGENLVFSAQRSAELKRAIVFAYIYEGAANWSGAQALLTIHQPGGAPQIEIALDETQDGARMCGVCLVEGGPEGFRVQREVQYVQGTHRALDALYGWGIPWVAGSK